MRTTLTLDADVAALLRRIQHTHGRSLEAVVNDALRQGLLQMMTQSGPSTHYRTPAVDLGRCLVASLDDVADVLAVAESEQLQ